MALVIIESGERCCIKCGMTKPLDEFQMRLDSNEKMSFQARCRDCLREPHRQMVLRNSRAARDRTKRRILSTNLCCYCRKPGADHFFKNTKGNDFDNWKVFHESCALRAKRKGRLPLKAMIRPKSELGGGK